MIKNPHIVVVGAGIIGAAIAFRLSQRGVRLTVVDAAEPGQGASAVSFAWINGHGKAPRHYHDLNRRSVDMWSRFARELGQDIGLVWGGDLRWVATEDGAVEFREEVRTLQSWGYPIHLLDEDTLKQREPNVATGSVTTASYSPIDGHVDTGKVVRACLARAAEQGAEIRTHTRVMGIQLAPTGNGMQRVQAVQASNTEIACDAIVIAGGPDSPEVASLAGLDLPLHYTFGATIITEPVPKLFQTTAVLHTPYDLMPKLNCRQLADGSIMIHSVGHNGSFGHTDEEVATIIQALVSYFPVLEGVKVKEVRRGRRPIPKDGLPIIGFTEPVPNLYLAAMHSGVSLAALVGEFAATEIVDETRINLLDPFRFERFR